MDFIFLDYTFYSLLLDFSLDFLIILSSGVLLLVPG